MSERWNLRDADEPPLTPAVAFARLVDTLGAGALEYLPALLSGRASELEMRGTMRAHTGRGLLVTMTVLALDPSQMDAMRRADLGEEGQA